MLVDKITLKDIGLFDTVLSRKEYDSVFENNT